jgi:hypothetical protein
MAGQQVKPQSIDLSKSTPTQHCRKEFYIFQVHFGQHASCGDSIARTVIQQLFPPPLALLGTSVCPHSTAAPRGVPTVDTIGLRRMNANN